MESDSSTSSTTMPTSNAHLTALKGVIQPYSGDEVIGEDYVVTFLAAVKKVAKICKWEEEQKILAVELSVRSRAKNYLAALKAQNVMPSTFDELETCLMRRFYLLNNENDREKMAQTMKMTSKEPVRAFADKVRIATSRLDYSTRPGRKRKTRRRN